MKQITGQSKTSNNNVVKPDNKDLTDKERTIKFLKCVKSNTCRVLDLLENKHPLYQPFLRHFARVFNNFIEKYLDGYIPKYVDNLDKRNFTEEKYTAIKNNFWQEKIILQEIIDKYPTFLEEGKIGPEFTDHDVKLFRYLRLQSRLLLENIGQEYELYRHISERFALIFNDLLEAFSAYYRINNIDNLQISSLQEKNLKIKETPETADTSSIRELRKRQKTVTKKQIQAKKRPQKDWPIDGLSHRHNKNRIDKEVKLRIPENLIEASRTIAENQGISRNAWIKNLIERGVKEEAPYLLQGNMALKHS